MPIGTLTWMMPEAHIKMPISSLSAAGLPISGLSAAGLPMGGRSASKICNFTITASRSAIKY